MWLFRRVQRPAYDDVVRDLTAAAPAHDLRAGVPAIGADRIAREVGQL